MEAPISILIAEDHEIVRYGISSYLSSADDITIAGETATGKECLQVLKHTEPDLCLLDISMPEKDGIETAKIIRTLKPDVKILILSMHIDRKKVTEVLKIGVDGYLLKDVDKADLLQGIRTIMKGQRVFSKAISDLMVTSLNYSQQDGTHANGISITKREKEILTLIVEGLTSKEIAGQLYISPRTVDTHRTNLMKKLDLNNTADLVRFAFKNKLVSL